MTSPDTVVVTVADEIPGAVADGIGGDVRRATHRQSSRPVQLRDVRREVLSTILVRLGTATDLASVASAVDACVPALADFAGVQLLDGLIRGDDAEDLLPGARLLVRAPLHAGPHGVAAEPVTGGRGASGDPWAGFRPGHALPAGSLLREAMESQRIVHHSHLPPWSAPSVAADADHDLPAAALRGGDLLAVPLICGGFTIGVLTLLRGPGRSGMSVADLEEIE